MGYIGCLEILATLPKTTRILNSAKALRLYSEKTIPLLFPHLIPKTVITRSKAVIADFLSAQSQIVLKPLYGFGGMDVFLIRSDDVNRDALIDMMCSRYPHGVIAQEFIPTVSHNERRLIMIDGQLKAVFKRIPEVGSIRSNTAVGGTATACVITADDEKIAETLSPFLRENEIMLCGVDAIDDKLIEVNITSPTGLLYANSLYGMHLEVDFWNAALAE
jgi:glutathione synthase